MQADGKPLTTTSKSFRMYRMKQSTPRYRLEGKTFHLLTVVRYVGPSLWECLCQCGRLKNVRTQNLLNGRTKSCGCWRLEVSKSRAAHWDTFVSPDITTKYPRTSMLSYLELVELVHNKVITGVKPERINAASIDVTLGPVIFVERPQANAKVVDLSAHPRQYPEFEEITMGDDGFVLHPGCFLLGSTTEVFNLPNYIQADYFLNSSLARAGLNHALAGFCLTGDTQIPLLNGTTANLRDLVGRETWVYSLDADNRVVPGFASQVWQTKEVDEVIEITLDDRSVVRCTPEHRFMTRAGQWITAENLPVGLPMMAIPRKFAPMDRRVPHSLYETVYSPAGHSRRWVFTHAMVDRAINGPLPRGQIVHHVDNNPTNNEPSNLRRMANGDHVKHHNKERTSDQREALSGVRSVNAVRINNGRWANDDNRKKASDWAITNNVHQPMHDFIAEHKDVWYQNVLLGYVKQAAQKLTDLGLPITPDNYAKHKRQNAPIVERLEWAFGSFVKAVEQAGYENHLVVAVRRVKLPHPIPVYDMTVDNHHNFVLSNGIVSHNCDPGWHGSNLTLELKNWTEWTWLRIRPGMKIGQVEFNRVTPVPEHRSYSAIGSYNNSQGVTVR